MTLDQLQADLDAVRAAIRDAVATGSQYSMSGSYAVTRQSLSDLRREEARLMRRILRYKGYGGRTVPDFGGEASSMEVPPNGTA